MTWDFKSMLWDFNAGLFHMIWDFNAGILLDQII